jgi:hypothetical protein
MLIVLHLSLQQLSMLRNARSFPDPQGSAGVEWNTWNRSCDLRRSLHGELPGM